MSPWFRDELRIVVCPRQVTVRPVRRTLTLRGARRDLQDGSTIACGPQAQPGQAALAALASAFPAGKKQRALATVILSNQFLRYVLVPWRAELHAADEEMAYARHCFARIHGKGSLAWEVRLSAQAPGLPRLASAIDADFLAGLRTVFSEAGIALRSIQPHLMAAFNEARRALAHGSGWLVLLEAGHLCVALLQRGQWSAVQGVRLRQSWEEELVPLLERQCFLGEDTTLPEDIYVGALDGGSVVLPELPRWRFHSLAAAAS